MGFASAVTTCLGKYGTFSGRARRSEFWWFALLGLLAGAVATVLDFLFGTGSISDGDGLIGAIVTLVLVLSNLAVSVRRPHDIGRSGWWLLLILLPVIGFLVLLYFFAKDGEANANGLGANSKAPALVD